VRIYVCSIVKTCLTIIQVRAHALKIKTTGFIGQLFIIFLLIPNSIPLEGEHVLQQEEAGRISKHLRHQNMTKDQSEEGRLT
jgi:hypothetical protein